MLDNLPSPLSSTDLPGRRAFAVIKRSVIIRGRKTSISLENAFWSGLKDIALRRNLTLSSLIESIDVDRETDNLSSAVRLFVLDYFRTRATSPVMIGERQTTHTPRI
jgi:predicted DNA-binding ribbon-helix-helix protein